MTQIKCKNGELICLKAGDYDCVDWEIAWVMPQEGHQAVCYEKEGFQGCSEVWTPGRREEPLQKNVRSVRIFSAEIIPEARRESGALQKAVDGWWTRSLQTRDNRLAWWREARFGMFIHWGVYSQAGNLWNGKNNGCTYGEHLMRAYTIPLEEYQQKLVRPFAGERFDADAIAQLAADSGMKYLVVTAKHHDGFAMYPSDVYPYDIRMTRFQGDPMAQLRDACRKHGLRFGMYYSHAFDWEHPDGAGNDWDYNGPGGDKELFAEPGKSWYTSSPELIPRIARYYVDGKAIPQIRELLRNYQPDLLWFDTAHKLPPSENLRILEAIREESGSVIVNGRIIQETNPDFRQFGDYINTSDRAAELCPTESDWEVIPTTNESYGYSCIDKSYKEPAHFIRLLAKATAKGGNVLLNIGPKGDGSVCAEDEAILRAVGGWMAGNGESISGCTKTVLPQQSWGVTTGKGQMLYLHVLNRPSDGIVRLAGMFNAVQRVWLLADREQTPLPVRRVNYYDWEIQVPVDAWDEADTVLAVSYEGKLTAHEGVLVSPCDDTCLPAFDAQLSPGLQFGSGKRGQDYICGWNNQNDTLRWRIRAQDAGRYQLCLRYLAQRTPGVCDTSNLTLAHDAGGSYRLSVGTVSQTRSVQLSQEVIEEPFVFDLPQGLCEITLQAVEITGRELMKPFGLVLRWTGRAERETAALEFDLTDVGM